LTGSSKPRKIGATGKTLASASVISRRLLLLLMSLLAVLLVSFSVVMGFYLLTWALQDQTAATVLLWVGRVLGVLLLIDVMLVVGVLGLMAMRE
jgi:hypothetical protein